MSIENVTKEQIQLLASILHQPTFEPYGNYAERVFCIEQQLDHSLLKPDFLRRLIQLPQSRYTPLCGLHKILNAKVVHQIFVLLATEVGVRLNSLVVAGREKLGYETWDRSILNLRSVHGAWLHPEVFWDTFGKTLDVPEGRYSDEDYMTKWIQEKDKCEACILARIGGDLDTVFDLQMLVKSRIRTRSVKKYREPRLGNVIDGWLLAWKLHYSTNEWEKKLEWNRLRASRLKAIRKSLAKEKRQARATRDKSGDQRTRSKRIKISAPMPIHGQQRADSNPTCNSPGHINGNHSAETIRVYLSSDLDPRDSNINTTESDHEDDEDVEVRKTVYATENDIIDCYAALISTPFLPGMDNNEHRKRASRLSQHRTTMITQLETPSWPMVADDLALKRSQSTKHKRPSNYSESVYSQPPNPPSSHSEPKRSNSIQAKHLSDKSWTTASIAPTSTSIPTRPHPRRPARHEQAFEPIQEESAPPVRYISKFKEEAISPITIQLPPTKYQNDNTYSPVSPLSPNLPFPVHDASRSREPRPRVHTRPSDPVDGHGPGTVGEHTVLLDSVRQLREDTSSRRSRSARRDTSATDTTRWSDVYGTKRDEVKDMEKQFTVLSTRSNSKSGRKERQK